MRVMRALISVSDKTGIVEFAKGLQALGIEIISTGGTAKTLRERGVNAIDVSEITGFPEMMEGRVKTLHPKIHGVILALREKKEHVQELKKHDIKPIDLVVVNLYPFEKTICTSDDLENAIENMDIDGPAMLRSAAKNYRAVGVIVNPKRYDEILKELKEKDCTLSCETREKLAAEAFAHTARYDTIISNYLRRKFGFRGFPENVDHILQKNSRFALR